MQKLILQQIPKLVKPNLILAHTQPVYLFSAAAAQQSKQMDKASELLLKKLKDRKERYASTKDYYRIDVGLIVERLPIFLDVDKQEFDNLKFRRYLQNKYSLKMTLDKDVMNFKQQHPTAETEKHDTDNLITHQNPETKEVYHKNSKVYKNTDPKIQDPKSIQYSSNYSVFLLVKSNGQWHFPSQSVFEKQSIQEVLQDLTNRVQNNVFSTYPQFLNPITCETREFLDNENDDKKNKGLKGVKCFYYNSLHIQGNVEDALKDQYEELAWVPRLQLQNYLNKSQYESFVHSLTE